MDSPAHQEIISNHPCFSGVSQVYINDGQIYGVIANEDECGQENESVTDLSEHEGKENVDEVKDDTETNENAKWSEFEVNLLIVTYKENAHKFKSPKYNSKQVWNVISNTLKKQNVMKDGVKCSEKWRNLKKMYEKVSKHNNSTGSNRKNWPYYEVPINTNSSL